MPHITIVPCDNNLALDGQFHHMDLSEIDKEIHALHFDTETGEGHVEFNTGKPNQIIDEDYFEKFTKYVDMWEAINNPPPPLPLTPEQEKELHNNNIWGQIDYIERVSMIPRVLRESLLSQPNAEQEPWYSKIKDIEDQIVALKAELL